MDLFPGMSDTYLGWGCPLLPKSREFICISLLSGCWLGAEYNETPSEQNISVEVPQMNPSKYFEDGLPLGEM